MAKSGANGAATAGSGAIPGAGAIPEPGAKGGGAAGYVQGLACGGLAALMPGTALLVTVLMAPGLAAVFLDRSPGRALGRAVLLFGACGLIAPLRDAYAAAGTLDPSLSVVLRVLTPLAAATAWLCAAAGLVLAEAAPMVIRLMLDARARRLTLKLTEERDALAREWSQSAG